MCGRIQCHLTPFVVTNITIGIYFYFPKYGNGVRIHGSILVSWYLVRFRPDVIKSDLKYVIVNLPLRFTSVFLLSRWISDAESVVPDEINPRFCRFNSQFKHNIFHIISTDGG